MVGPNPRDVATQDDALAADGDRSAFTAHEQLQQPEQLTGATAIPGGSTAGGQHEVAPSRWAIVLLLTAASLALALLVSQSRQASAIARDKTADLATIAQLKAAQISQRLLERRQSTYGVAADVPFVREVMDWLGHGAPPGAAADRIASRLRLARRSDEFGAVYLLDAAGRVVLSDAPDGRQPARFVLNIAVRAMRTGRVQFVDIHRASANSAMRFGFVVPLGAPPVRPGSPAAGALFFADDAQRWVFPLTQSWPGPTASGEALLMRRDGQESIYLHGLRHRKDAALTPWLPIEEKDLSTADLVVHGRGVLTGRDYRGVEVIAAAYAVPATPWFLICKLDRAEAFEHSEQLVRLTALLLVSVLALSALIGYRMWRGPRSGLWRRPDRWCRARGTEKRRPVDESMRLYAAVFESAAEAILITDADRRIVAVNPSFTEITGYRPEEAIGRTPSLLSSGRHDRAFYQQMWSQLNDTGRWQGEIWNRRKNGEIYPEWQTITAIVDEQNRVANYVAMFTDITERKARDEKVSYLAYHDPLTMLPNRLLLEDRLGQAIRNADRAGHRVGVMLLDLDRFKSINDSLGHQTGDLVLQAVAARLQESVRHSDTVSRLGGDEFVVVLPEIGSTEDAVRASGKIARALARPIQARGHRLTITPSIGVSVYPDDATTSDALLEHADRAMYRTKRTRGNTTQAIPAERDGRAATSAMSASRLH